MIFSIVSCLRYFSISFKKIIFYIEILCPEKLNCGNFSLLLVEKRPQILFSVPIMSCTRFAIGFFLVFHLVPPPMEVQCTQWFDHLSTVGKFIRHPKSLGMIPESHAALHCCKIG